MNTQKILTLSVAAYNMEAYLARSLDSVLDARVLDHIEILVINDGSKDGTLRIAREYEQKYPDTVRAIDKFNGGHGSTVNKGMELARGKYFKLLDADDWFDTDAFVQLVEYLKTTDSDLVVTNYSKEFLFENRSVPMYFKNVEHEKIYDFERWMGVLDCTKDWFELPAITYKTNILQQNKIRISECFYCDIEYDAWPLQYVKELVFLNLSVYKYFIGREGQSVSAQGSTRHYLDNLKVTQNMVEYFINNEHIENQVLKSLYLRMVLSKIRENYVVLMRLYTDRSVACRLLKEFDHYVKDKSMYLYREAAEGWILGRLIKPIVIWRKYGYNIYQSFVYRVSRAIYLKRIK